jgi:UDP-glucose 4-epimerase
MHVAVTGGRGFIGTHVVGMLAAAGHQVRALDVTPGSGPAVSGVTHRTVDVLDAPALTEALRGVEVVFHLAGMSNVDFAFTDPAGTVRLNIDGTANVLEVGRVLGLRRVVLASTVWVYGAAAGALEDDAAALTEAAPMVPARAGHIYTATKIAAELLVHSYAETYGIPFTILRYGVPYGPGMRGELVLARFVRKALDGEALTVAGDGKQYRNYVFVRDLARAHVLALDDAAENQVIALEGAERVTVLDIAEAVQARFPGTAIEHVPARPADFRGIEVSNAHAARVLGWQPSTTFTEGVAQYVDWYLAHRARQ